MEWALPCDLSLCIRFFVQDVKSGLLVSLELPFPNKSRTMSLELAQPPALEVLKEGYEAAHLPAVRVHRPPDDPGPGLLQEVPKEPDPLLLPPDTSPRLLRILTGIPGFNRLSDCV